MDPAYSLRSVSLPDLEVLARQAGVGGKVDLAGIGLGVSLSGGCCAGHAAVGAQ